METFGILKYEWQTNLGTYPETPILYTIARVNGSDRSKNGTLLCVVSKRVITNHCQLRSNVLVHLQEKLSNFFKAYIVPYLLSAKQLCICPKCGKVCCEPDEINNKLENSVLCDFWYHWKCVGIKGNPSDDTWVCADLHALRMCPLLLQLWHMRSLNLQLSGRWFIPLHR